VANPPSSISFLPVSTLITCIPVTEERLITWLRLDVEDEGTDAAEMGVDASDEDVEQLLSPEPGKRST
jgi:hypothetical protein